MEKCFIGHGFRGAAQDPSVQLSRAHFPYPYPYLKAVFHLEFPGFHPTTDSWSAFPLLSQRALFASPSWGHAHLLELKTSRGFFWEGSIHPALGGCHWNDFSGFLSAKVDLTRAVPTTPFLFDIPIQALFHFIAVQQWNSMFISTLDFTSKVVPHLQVPCVCPFFPSAETLPLTPLIHFWLSGPSAARNVFVRPSLQLLVWVTHRIYKLRLYISFKFPDEGL